MKRLGISLALLLASTFAHAMAPSAVRAEWESMEAARQKASRAWSLPDEAADGKQAYYGAVVLKDLDRKLVTTTYTETELAEGFAYVRDSRFLDWEAKPDFRRRSTWLYPDDGCWARASLMGMNLTKKGLKRPLQVYAFGNLRVETPNSAKGYVTWWYHVAPAVKVGEEIFILDPAVSPQAPLKLDDWFKKMGATESTRAAICQPQTYTPYSDCTAPNLEEEESAVDDQSAYLTTEWNRLRSLGRNPETELGELPPWATR